MVESNQKTISDIYTYFIRGPNDDVNERTQEVTAKYSEDPNMAEERLQLMDRQGLGKSKKLL